MHQAFQQLQQIHQDMMKVSQDFQNLHQHLHQAMQQLQQEVSFAPMQSGISEPNRPSPMTSPTYGQGYLQPPFSTGGAPNQPQRQSAVPSSSYFSSVPKQSITGAQSLGSVGEQPVSTGPSSTLTNTMARAGTGAIPTPGSQPTSISASLLGIGSSKTLSGSVRPDALQGRQSENTMYGRH